MDIQPLTPSGFGDHCHISSINPGLLLSPMAISERQNRTVTCQQAIVVETVQAMVCVLSIGTNRNPEVKKTAHFFTKWRAEPVQEALICPDTRLTSFRAIIGVRILVRRHSGTTPYCAVIRPGIRRMPSADADFGNPLKTTGCPRIPMAYGVTPNGGNFFRQQPDATCRIEAPGGGAFMHLLLRAP